MDSREMELGGVLLEERGVTVVVGGRMAPPSVAVHWTSAAGPPE